MTITWFAIRGSGIAAYAMVSIATIFGLLVSTKVLGPAAKAKGLMWFHESVGLAAVLATGVHMAALTLDEHVEFGPRELFVPGASGFRPMAIALGVMAFYGITIVAFSFYVKQWIGQTWWRSIHFLSFGGFVAASAHGIMAGTDTGNPVVLGMYIAVSSAVALLLVVRIAQARGPKPPVRARPSPSAGRSVEPDEDTAAAIRTTVG